MILHPNNGGMLTDGVSALGNMCLRQPANCEAIAAEAHLFNLLVNSLSPAIFGHEIVKAGLLLGLLGGTPAACADGAHLELGLLLGLGLGCHRCTLARCMLARAPMWP